ncbi:MAG TPA: hypothetical protein VJ302_13400 [Blastocatellia bacterium]|nr:hypothetical protein [Blastocatellia bacterium]
MRSAWVAFLLISLLPQALFSQTPAVQPETNPNRAQEILKQGRESIGGESVLTEIRSLSAGGNVRVVSGNREIRGELKLKLLLPDRFMRTMSLTLGSKEITATEIVNGDRVQADPLPITDLPAADPGASARERQVRSEFYRFLIAVLPAPAWTSQFSYSFQREMKMKVGKFDLLSVKGPDGFAVWLYVDQRTHRPSMLSYLAPAPPETGNQQLNQDETGEPIMINYQCVFSDYRHVGDLWLPHQMTRTADGRVIEEWRIHKYKLNPELKPGQFEKRR